VLRAALDAAPAVAASADRPSPGGRPLLGPADAAALLPVLRREAPLAVVADREADIRQALSLAKERNLRLVILGGAEAWRVARELAEARVPVVLDPLDDLPTSPETIGARPENAALLAAAGVEIGFAVSGQGVYLSYLPGVGLRQGAGVAVANGLPYARALAAITSAPKRIWGGDADAGVIAPGRPADLVLWDGDPLEPVSGPLAIFADGRQVSPVTRQTLLRDRYRPARAQAPR
jgi:imidazolonepropionase-like amidohydrolase